MEENDDQQTQTIVYSTSSSGGDGFTRRSVLIFLSPSNRPSLFLFFNFYTRINSSSSVRLMCGLEAKNRRNILFLGPSYRDDDDDYIV